MTGPCQLLRSSFNTSIGLLTFTDNKTITYLKVAKELNSRQARWALVFAWLNFLITYRPSSRIMKSNALSHLFRGIAITPQWRKPLFCCPPASIGSLTWEIESLVCNVQRDKPNPNSLFVPSSVQSQVGDIQPNSPAILVKNFFIDCSGGLSSLKTHLTMCQPVKYMTRINLLLLGLQDYSDCYQLPGNLGPI